MKENLFKRYPDITAYFGFLFGILVYKIIKKESILDFILDLTNITFLIVSFLIISILFWMILKTLKKPIYVLSLFVFFILFGFLTELFLKY